MKFRTEKAKELFIRHNELTMEKDKALAHSGDVLLAALELKASYGKTVSSPEACAQGMNGCYTVYKSKEAEKAAEKAYEDYLKANNYRSTMDILSEYSPLIRESLNEYYKEQYGVNYAEYTFTKRRDRLIYKKEKLLEELKKIESELKEIEDALAKNEE